ncbi:unnamed protein product [Peronospora belbahrii]|uniref:RxLR effector protein n=1 Tax=Peronospora belbahrii TaxID=622444 RepID=A0ABN8CL41_9STRA|nr:unnamed protein product [Peronospora belbahrii]
MRIHLVLTCAAIPACLFGRGSQARLSDLIITSSLLLLPAPVKGTTKRHLRDVDDDNEERVSFSSEVELAESMLPSFENISVEEWLNIKLPADNPFPNWIHYNGEGNLLASSDMANLIEEMKLTNRLNPYKTTLYDTIINQLGRKKLWQIINAGMKDESTKQLATQLSWLYSNTKPAKCFELMELNTGEKNLLASPELEHFNSYLESYNKKNPTRQVTLFGILRNHFGKKRLEDIIHAGLEDSSTLKLAQQLQWLADNKDPAEYFKLFEFTFSGKKDGNFLTNPNLVHVINYVEDFNRRHYNSQVTLFGILDNHFGRNLLSDIIQVGKEDFITLSLAMHLDRLANKKTPDDLLTDVFKSTSTNNKNNNFLGSQLFANWMAYRESFNKVYPDDQGKLFEILYGHFGKDNLAEIIRVGKTDLDTKSLAKQLEWMSDNKTPEVVFKRDFWEKKGIESSNTLRL